MGAQFARVETCDGKHRPLPCGEILRFNVETTCGDRQIARLCEDGTIEVLQAGGYVLLYTLHLRGGAGERGRIRLMVNGECASAHDVLCHGCDGAHTFHDVVWLPCGEMRLWIENAGADLEFSCCTEEDACLTIFGIQHL
jgi:hypothetical protein